MKCKNLDTPIPPPCVFLQAFSPVTYLELKIQPIGYVVPFSVVEKYIEETNAYFTVSANFMHFQCAKFHRHVCFLRGQAQDLHQFPCTHVTICRLFVKFHNNSTLYQLDITASWHDRTRPDKRSISIPHSIQLNIYEYMLHSVKPMCEQLALYIMTNSFFCKETSLFSYS